MANEAHQGVPDDKGAGTPDQTGVLATLFERLLSSLDAIGSLWIFPLVVLINADAFGRTPFAAPIDGVIEMIELSLVGIVFLQLGDATRCGRLTRSDGVFKIVLNRWPHIGRLMGAAFDLIGALFMAIILWGSIPLLMDSIRENYYVGNEGVFTAPVWPVKTVIVIGCTVTMLQFIAFAWRYLRPGQRAAHQNLR